eukprot:487060_1
MSVQKIYDLIDDIIQDINKSQQESSKNILVIESRVQTTNPFKSKSQFKGFVIGIPGNNQQAIPGPLIEAASIVQKITDGLSGDTINETQYLIEDKGCIERSVADI